MSITSSNGGLLPAEHRGRILGLAAMVFLILGSYAIARPATESLFVEMYGAEAIPKAWLLVAIGSVVLVSAYSHWAARVDLVRAFGLVSALSAWALVGCLMATEMDLPGARYALFLWKDIYIVMLVEIFWSFANQVIPIKKATWLYGFFLVIGGLGGMMGNLLGGEVASLIGTRSVLVVVVPMLLIARLGCLWMGRGVSIRAYSSGSSQSKAGLSEGIKLLFGSRVLLLLMALIALTQVVINLIDYQTQIALELYYPVTDERTQIMGRIYAAVDLVALSLQLTTGPILRGLGVPLVMVLIPGLLLGFVVGAAAWPRLIMIAITKVASKAFDYSIFRAAKELFYIPLSHTEKTQGKAFVDMMTYRVSKGLVSILLLGLGSVAAGWIWGLTGLALLAWMAVVLQLVRRVPEVTGSVRTAEDSG
jgi:AAA family ATP:ADP antiporter